MAQPIIGLTLDAEQPGGYSKLPWYAIRENYCAAVVRAGGLPVLLPHEVEQADAYLGVIDGLIVTGGARPPSARLGRAGAPAEPVWWPLAHKERRGHRLFVRVLSR